MIQINYSIDDRGLFKVVAAPPNEPLAEYIQTDINGRARVCRELLQVIDNLLAGAIVEDFSRTGNCCTLILTPEKAQIDFEFTDPIETFEISLIEFKQAITECLAFAESIGRG